MRIRPAAQMALHDPVTRRCLMHPNLPDLYRRKVSELERPLDEGADPEEARRLICLMIDRIVLKPSLDAFAAVLHGELAAIVAVCAAVSGPPCP